MKKWFLISKRRLTNLYINQGLKQAEIAEMFGTSQGVISKKIKEYGILKPEKRYKNANKQWTDEQKEFLMDNFAKMSYEEIGTNKKILKTPKAVQQMAINELKLGDPKLYDDCITKTTFLKKIKISSYLMNKWIEKFDLPIIKKVISIKKEYEMISISDFWVWAEQHKELIKWNKFEEGVIGLEPEWARKARNDYRKKYSSKHGIFYTNEDDKYIMSAYKAGIPISKIAERLNRTIGGIYMRLNTIQAERRNNYWTDEEKEQLKKLVADGHRYKEIMKIMDKDFYAIKGAIERYITRPLRNIKG